VKCRDVINGSLRKIGKLGAGREPRLADQTDAMEALRNVYRQLIAQGSFGQLRDVVPLGDYTAGENERIFRNSDATNTITLPEIVSRWTTPRSYADENDNYGGLNDTTRPPRDCAVVVISDAFTGITADFIYDGSIKKWQSLYELTLNDEAPLSHRNPQGLQAYLSGQVVDEYGSQLGQMTTMQAAGFISSMTHRYDSIREPFACGGAIASGGAAVFAPSLQLNNKINSQYFASLVI
jgi:hypothetical protein